MNEQANTIAVDFGTTNSYFCKCPKDQLSPVGVDFGSGRDGIPTAILYRQDKSPLIGNWALHEYGEATPEERSQYRLRTQFKPDIAAGGDAASAASLKSSIGLTGVILNVSPSLVPTSRRSNLTSAATTWEANPFRSRVNSRPSP